MMKFDYKGKFITFEGIDYSGKSVQAKQLLENLKLQNIPCTALRDPGATRISEKIRGILLDNDHNEMTKWTELLLYEAARAQMVEESIIPALKKGEIVVCDRFYDSTSAYQGFGRELDLEMVNRANSIGSVGLVPDLTFLIDIDVKSALERRLRVNEKADRLEAQGDAFQERVRKGYLAIAEQEAGRFRVINGDDSVGNIARDIFKEFMRIM